MKALKVIAVAALFAVPMSASAMCSWGLHEATSTASVCDAGQIFDETKQECVDTVG
ncbi:MAG: cyclic lactone autoinducer peptide [Pseudomonadota bacterium]